MTQIKSQTVLVTGGAGFIESHIVDRLMAGRHQIRVLDNLSTGNLANIQARATVGRLYRIVPVRLSSAKLLSKNRSKIYRILQGILRRRRLLQARPLTF